MKKKLLFLHDAMPFGGVETALLNTIPFLDRDKYDVSVMLMQEGGELYNYAKKVLPMKRVFCRFLPWNNRVVAKIKSMFVNFIERNYYKYPKMYHRLAINEKYDIEISFCQFRSHRVISNSPNKRSKKILWLHGNFVTDEYMVGYYERHPELTQDLYSYDRIVFVSEMARECFHSRINDIGVPTTVKYNAIDRTNIISKSKLQIDPQYHMDTTTFCAVGRMVLEKGFARLVNICSSLKKKKLNFRLFIIGDGPEMKKIEESVRINELEDTVFLPGFDNNPYKYIVRSRFLVCSSFTEGLPVVCQESLALGIPVVSSFPSVGELFGGETCGILSEVDDDSLMAAIEKMLTDEEFYKKCKAGAEKRAEYFDPKNSIKEIEKMFDELLENDG